MRAVFSRLAAARAPPRVEAPRRFGTVSSSICAELLKRTMGLDEAAIGPTTIERAVHRRMAACAMTDLATYERHIVGSDHELQQLVEAAVVPETWFFRDNRAFVEMVRTVSAKAGPTDSGEPLRLLSLPCSTGEEPYSLAMALLDADFPSARFRIDAVDISARVLTFAERAVYGNNSFRGTDLAFRQRHFEGTATGHRLSDRVRETVRFAQGNIFGSGFLPECGTYDIIFCRNLLVYFDEAAQTRAIETLRRLLTDDGTIFVGPAEAAMMSNHAFTWSKAPLAFAFTKQRAAVAQAGGARSAPPRERRPLVPALANVVSPAGRAVARSRVVAPLRLGAPDDIDLADATRLADAGHLSEAAKVCAAHLRARGSSAPAFYLMGLISDSAGNAADASTYFKKALYLDSEHVGSLVHLALLLEKRGDLGGARLLRERLRRRERNDAGPTG